MDAEASFVIIGRRVGQGPDPVCGQLMRCMGWVKRHLADGKRAHGIIIAQRISDSVRYALVDMPDVRLREYELHLEHREAEPVE